MSAEAGQGAADPGGERGGVLARFHAWMTRAPSQLERDASELFAVTGYTVFIGLLAYLSFIPLFLAVGAPLIAGVNVGVVAVFGVAFILVRRGRVFGGMLVASGLVIAHAWLTTLMLGWDCAFQLHIILALELGLLFTNVPVRTRLLLAAGVVAAYLGLLVVADLNPPALELGHEWQQLFALLNSAVFLVVTIGIASYYAWMVRRNRSARDRAFRRLEHRNEQLRRSEEALGEARDRAEAGNQAKSMFLANMSHELRTPLNAIIGYSEMIAEDAEDAGQDELVDEVEKIRRAGRHLLNLINDVLDLSKIEAGRMEYERIEFDLRTCVEDVVSTTRTLAREKGNELRVTIPPALPAMRSDPTKVGQILLNLVSNACKFTEDGTIEVNVVAVSIDDRDGVELAVRDTGIGIPPDRVDRIFAEFSQADESTTRKFGGTGLGLAISHRFCQALGGTIAVESKVGEGSTFRVWLPTDAGG